MNQQRQRYQKACGGSAHPEVVDDQRKKRRDDKKVDSNGEMGKQNQACDNKAVPLVRVSF